MTEFSSIGDHCAAGECNQRDFLPFVCDCCGRKFCLPHRSYKAHNCAKAGARDFRAIVCPLCKQTIRLAENEDPNTQWELHTRQGCDPSKYNMAKKVKRRCGAAGCREALGLANEHMCNKCGRTVCLSHRFPDSHGCTSDVGRGTPGGSRSASASPPHNTATAAREPSIREKRIARLGGSGGGGGGRGGAQRPSPPADNTLRGSAQRRMLQAPGAPQGGIPPEVCEACGARFQDVGLLVAHAETAHAHPHQGTGAVQQVLPAGDGCPFCGEHFSDPARLVQHVENRHSGITQGAVGGGSKTSCVAS